MHINRYVCQYPCSNHCTCYEGGGGAPTWPGGGEYYAWVRAWTDISTSRVCVHPSQFPIRQAAHPHGEVRLPLVQLQGESGAGLAQNPQNRGPNTKFV